MRGYVKPLTKQLVKDIASFLAYHASAGIDSYPASDELARLMTRHGRERVLSPVSHGRSRRQDISREPGKQEEVQVHTSAFRAEAAGLALQEIVQEVGRCHACSLSSSRKIPVAGIGSVKCRLLIIGDWLSVDREDQLPENCQFGLEQDRMLKRMLEAIKLDRNEVFVTNVIKCGIPASKQPRAEHANTCLSFLQRQISVLRPQLILAMGMIAARALLNRPESLSRLRGRLHRYQSSDKMNIPLIATYHPTFLLQNEGMKKATWADLQLAAKQLAQVSR